MLTMLRIFLEDQWAMLSHFFVSSNSLCFLHQENNNNNSDWPYSAGICRTEYLGFTLLREPIRWPIMPCVVCDASHILLYLFSVTALPLQKGRLFAVHCSCPILIIDYRYHSCGKWPVEQVFPNGDGLQSLIILRCSVSTWAFAPSSSLVAPARRFSGGPQHKQMESTTLWTFGIRSTSRG